VKGTLESSNTRDGENHGHRQTRKHYAHFKKTTVRQLTYILTFIISTTLTAYGQSNTKSIFEKSKIDIETVDYIEINNKSEQLDSIQQDKKRLNEKQKNEFVSKWNNSTSVGTIKSLTSFYITVHFNDGTTRKFRGFGKFLKEDNDFGFDLGDFKYLETLWDELNIDHMNNIRNVFEDSIKYQESTDL
jgi:hypothetical protein